LRLNKKNTIYLVSLKKELQEAAEHVGITAEEGADILDNFFITLRKYLSDPRLPLIKLGDFGYFQTKYTTINGVLSKLIKTHKSQPTKNNYAIFLENFIKFWKIRRRIFLARLKKLDGINWEKVDTSTYLQDEGRRILGDRYEQYFNEKGEIRKDGKR
jgi:hypothetical protein